MIGKTNLTDLLSSWDARDLSILATIAGIDTEKQPNVTPEAIADQVRWLYHSKTRHQIKDSLKGLIVKDHVKGIPPCPTYEELLRAAAKKMGIKNGTYTMPEFELYIPEAVIAQALIKMDPESRHKFFVAQMDATPLWEAAGVRSRDLRGAKTAATVLALANASGFAIYAGATTALGFVTHAVGITLPFAAYTGLSSTIAYVIGPPGWMALATFGFFKLTEIDWNKLMPVVLMLIATKSRYAIGRSETS